MLGTVNRSNVVEKLKPYDYGIVWHCDPTSADEVLPGKIFEYIKSGLPVVVCASSESYASTFVSEHGIGRTINPDDMNFTEQLAVLKNSDHHREYLYNYLVRDFSEYSRLNQFKKIDHFLNK